MKVFEALRSIWNTRTVTQVQLMTEEMNHIYQWQGTAYNMDVVRAAIRPKVKAIGKLTARHIVEGVDEKGNRTIKNGASPSIRLLLSDPNPIMTGQMLLEKMAAQLCLNGNAFAVIIRDELGNPTQMYPLAPDLVEAQYHAGKLYLRFTLHNGKMFTFPYTDVIHLRQDFNSNDVFGTPLAPALVPLLDVVSATDQGVISAIKNSGVVKWLLKFTNSMRPEDLKDRSKEFAQNFLETSSATGVAAVDTKAEAQQITPQDYVPNAAQMDRTTQRIYALLNTNQKIVQNTCTENERAGYFDDEIEPVVKQLTGEFTKKLFTRRMRAVGNRIVFEASSWDGASYNTKLRLSQMVDRGAMSPNEWRLTFNMVPRPGGDEFIRRLDTEVTSRPKRERGDANED